MSSRGARAQFLAAVLLTSVIPILALVFLNSSELGQKMDAGARRIFFFALGLVLVLGYVLLFKYPVTIRKLRRYLENMVQGELPDRIDLVRTESDIAVIENSLNLILARLKERLKVVETEKQRLEIELFQSRELEAVGTLAAGIAHEISTPVQFISNNIQFLAKASETLWGVVDRSAQAPHAEGASLRDQEQLIYLRREMAEAVQQTLEGVERIATMVRTMKDFAQKGAAHERTLIDLNKAVTDTVAVSRHEWKYVAQIQLDLDSALPPVLCFSGEIKQTLISLITNAAHAIAERRARQPLPMGLISIATRREKDHVLLAVTDNGTGIPPGIRDRVFEPFFTTRELGRGYGLTLAYASVVKRHGGSLTYDTEENKGTTFRVALPASAEAGLERGTHEPE